MTSTIRIVRIGNSQGFRVPRMLLDEARLSEDLEIEALPGRITIRSAKRARDGWEEAARRMRDAGDDTLIDPLVANEFDRSEWEW